MKENEEISLKDLIQIVLQGWKIILASLVVILGISTLLYFAYNSPTFVTKSNESIIYIPDQITEFGIYTLPYKSTDDFLIILKKEEFNQYIADKTSISIDEVSKSINYLEVSVNEFLVTVTNGNKENSKKIHDAFLAYSNDYLNYVINDNAINQIGLTLNLKLASLNRIVTEKTNVLNYLENELTQTPILLNGNNNPLYSSLTDQLVKVKTEIVEATYAINHINEDLPNLDLYKANIISFNAYLLSTSSLSISKIKIEPNNITSFEAYRFSAKTLFPISAILGVMLGVFIVFFKKYWEDNTKK